MPVPKNIGCNLSRQYLLPSNSTTQPRASFFRLKDFLMILELLLLRNSISIEVGSTSGIRAVTEASVRRDLQLDDKEGTDCLPNATIFEELTKIGYEKLSQKLTFYKALFSPQWKFLIHTILQCLSAKTTAWNEFNSTMAAAIICLAINQKHNFSKYIFESMVKNLDNAGKFLMYPRRSKRKDTEVPQHSDPINVADEAVNEEPSMQLKELMDFCTKLQQRVLDLENTKTAQAQEITSLKLKVKKLEKKGGSRNYKLRRLYKVGRSARVVSSDEASLGDQGDASKQERKIHDINADEDITLENVHDAKMFDVNDLHYDEVFVEKEVPIKEPSESITTTTTTIPSKDKAEFDKEVRLAREKDKANVALTKEWNDIQAKIDTNYELAQRLQAEEQEEFTIDEKATLFQQLLEKRRKHFTAKRAEEERNRPPIRAQQRSIMCTYLKNMAGWKPKYLKSKSFVNIQELFDKAFKRVKTFVNFRTELVEGTKMEESSKKVEIAQEGSSKRVGDELEQENAKKQKVDDDQEASKMKDLIKLFLMKRK
ncbi:hypothetical protein Tco_0863343 [Tanacetum coccineum]